MTMFILNRSFQIFSKTKFMNELWEAVGRVLHVVCFLSALHTGCTQAYVSEAHSMKNLAKVGIVLRNTCEND